MSGYVDVGGGLGAAVLANGMLNVVAGPLFAQIERERVEGPRYVEAFRGARELRATHVMVTRLRAFVLPADRLRDAGAAVTPMPEPFAVEP